MSRSPRISPFPGIPFHDIMSLLTKENIGAELLEWHATVLEINQKASANLDAYDRSMKREDHDELEKKYIRVSNTACNLCGQIAEMAESIGVEIPRPEIPRLEKRKPTQEEIERGKEASKRVKKAIIDAVNVIFK